MAQPHADKLILTLDQGTTSSRAMLIDRDGQVHDVAQQEIEPSYPHPGWVNQDAMELW